MFNGSTGAIRLKMTFSNCCAMHLLLSANIATGPRPIRMGVNVRDTGSYW